MDRAGFDPRYSPEFQRGFDPAVHDGPAATSETHERIPATSDPSDPRVPPAPPAPGSAPREVVPPPQRADAEGDHAAVDTADGVTEMPEPPWKNPYLVVLTILGVVLLAIGVSAFRWSVEQVYQGQFGFGGENDEARDAWLAAQVAWGLAPLLALAGLLTLIGVVFFIAVTWRAYRRPAEDEYGDVEDIDSVG